MSETTQQNKKGGSKASGLDSDDITTYGDNKLISFSDKRIHRSLYRTTNARLINDAVQVAMNIGRKELGDEWLKELLEVDRGIMDMPVAIRKIRQKMDFRWLLKLGENPRTSVRR